MQAVELIADAYYLSGIVGREFSNVTDTQTIDGLRWLNQIISQKSINATLIPYQGHYSFTAVTGQPIYSVPGLVDLMTMTFNLGNVRFYMIRDTVNRFFGADRVDDVQSLPFHFYAERQISEMIIYLYFVPSQTFTMKITGKFELGQIANVNLPIIYDPFYLKYLTYELCSDICDHYNIEMPNKPMKTLVDLRRSLRDITGIDLSLETPSFFPARPSYDQTDATLSRGWRP